MDPELRTQLLDESKDLTRRGQRYEYFGAGLVFAASGAIIAVSKPKACSSGATRNHSSQA
jgi:hypothetical protein